MGVEITVAVRISGGSDKSEVTFTERRSTSDGNPKFYATSVEGALVEASRSILDQIVSLHGDIRDENPDPGSLSRKEAARVLTEPTQVGPNRGR